MRQIVDLSMYSDLRTFKNANTPFIWALCISFIKLTKLCKFFNGVINGVELVSSRVAWYASSTWSLAYFNYIMTGTLFLTTSEWGLSDHLAHTTFIHSLKYWLAFFSQIIRLLQAKGCIVFGLVIVG